MSKKWFWIRLIAYIVIGGILPLTFMGFRFHLFRFVSDTKIALGGWTIVFIIFLSVFFIKLAKAVKKGMKFSYWTQLLEGFYKVIVPMIAAVMILDVLNGNIGKVIELLLVAIPCEAVAIAINPIPTWAHQNHLEESGENLGKVLKSAGILDFFKKEEGTK